MDIQALATELAAGHPVTGAYAADPQDAANQINAVNVTRIKASMTGSEMWAQTVPAEYQALSSDVKRNQWLAFCAIQEHNPENGGLAQMFVVNLFGGGSATVAALQAARNETVSRAEVLGLGLVTLSHIMEARGQLNG